MTLAPCRLLLTLSALLGCFYHTSTQHDGLDEDVFGEKAARCRARCAEKFLVAPIKKSADDDCLYGRNCYQCLEMCTSLTSHYYQWLYLCSVNKFCKSGCKSACKFVTRMQESDDKDVPDRRNLWTWTGVTSAQQGRVMVVRWVAPRRSDGSQQNHTMFPVYNLVWRDLEQAGTIPRHYQWSMDGEVRLPLSKVTSHFELKVQAFKKEGLIAETTVTLAFAQADAPLFGDEQPDRSYRPYRVEEELAENNERHQTTSHRPAAVKPSPLRAGETSTEPAPLVHSYVEAAIGFGVGVGCLLLLIVGVAVALYRMKQLASKRDSFKNGVNVSTLLASQSPLAFAGINLTDAKVRHLPEKRLVHSIRCNHGSSHQKGSQRRCGNHCCCHEREEVTYVPRESSVSLTGGRLVTCSLCPSVAALGIKLNPDVQRVRSGTNV